MKPSKCAMCGGPGTYTMTAEVGCQSDSCAMSGRGEDSVEAWNALQSAIRAAKAEAWDEGREAGYSDGLTDGHPLGQVYYPATNPYTEQESENHE